MRTILPVALCGCAVSLWGGCTHMVESRVVQAFSESLKDHDLARMKAEASDDFEEKAIKGDETFRVLELIELPEGMVKVINVKPIRDEKSKKVIGRLVLATVGKDKRKVRFRLKPDGDTGRWVVDDLFLSRDDYENNRSVATRLAVLLSVQESLDAWRSGDRDKILAAVTPEFTEALSHLPPEHLAQFARKATDGLAPQTKVLPDERIGEETADLRVAKAEGEILLKFRRDGQRWRLDDLAIESRRAGEDIASARHVAAAMAAAIEFEAAYRSSDKRSLQQLSTKRFFEGSLADADLTQFKLPTPGPGADGLDAFDIKLEGTTATFVVPSGPEVLKISLMQQPAEQMHAAPRFLVDEVTIYDSTQDKLLSSLFTANATMERFSLALAKRDVATLSGLATADFRSRVWNNVTPAHFDGLPMIRLAAAKPRVLQTQFRGSMTEILVEIGETPLTFVLREEAGKILVDDVLTPAPGWPESMKATVEALIPVLNFTSGLQDSDLSLVRGSASEDFSKYAWNHLDNTASFEPNPASFFSSQLKGINLAGERAEVVYGDDGRGARFALVKEHGEFKVDDVMLVAGPSKEQHVPMKRALRTQLARGGLR